MAGRGEFKDIEAFVTDLDVGAFPHTIDADGTIWQEFDVFGQPAFAFINDDGSTTLHNGGMGHEDLSTAIEALIAQ